LKRKQEDSKEEVKEHDLTSPAKEIVDIKAKVQRQVKLKLYRLFTLSKAAENKTGRTF
jgi:hypothetical protein